MGFAHEVELDLSLSLLAACRDYFGYVPAVYRSQSILPRLLQVQIGLEAAILYEDSSLTHSQKERFLLMLAATEGCIDLATAHYERLRVFGEPEAELDRLVTDYRHCGLPAAEIELLRFVLKLGANGPAVGIADIEALIRRQWAPEPILETILMTA